MGKLLDITSRMKSQDNRSQNSASFKTQSDAVGSAAPVGGELYDMTEARQEMLNRERRQVKRTILTEFVGAFVILPEQGLLKVALYDISENGVAFDLEITDGRFQQGDEVAMRVYLNHSTYFPFTIKIANSRAIEEEGLVRHGSNFVRGTLNDVALHHFVKFIENVSASLKKDDGDILVSNIS